MLQRQVSQCSQGRSRRIALTMATVLVLSVVAVVATGAAGAAAPLKEFKIGRTDNVTGAFGSGGARDAYQAYVDQLNAAGGVDGYKITVVDVDSGGDPSKTAAAMKQFVESDKVNMIVSGDPVGFPGAEQYLAGVGIPVYGCSAELGCYKHANMFPISWGLGNESATLTAQYAVTHKIKPMALETINHPLGFAQAAGVRAALKAAKVPIALDDVFPISETDFTGVAAKLLSSGAKGMDFSAYPQILPQLEQAVAQQNYTGLVFSPTSLDSMAKNSPAQLDGKFLVFTVTGGYSATKAETKMLATMRKASSSVAAADNGTIAGAVTQGELLKEALTRLGTKEPTYANLISAFQSIKNWSGTFNAPITYANSGPQAQPTKCGQIIEIEKGKWVVDGPRWTCQNAVGSKAARAASSATVAPTTTTVAP
jgi:ABC-type branched-subunit amino acid transport system substrate-binding protein